MQRLCWSDETWILDVNVWRNQIFCWISSTSIETWYICDPIQIYQGDTKKNGLEDSKLVITPMVTGHKLSKNDDSAEVN